MSLQNSLKNPLQVILRILGDTISSGRGVSEGFLEQLRKFSLYTNLKKYRFHQDKVRFLGYVVFSKDIRIEDERIEVVKRWPEPQSVRDIQVFLGFANFHCRFIQGLVG